MRLPFGSVLISALLTLQGCGDSTQDAGVAETIPTSRLSPGVELATELSVTEVDSTGVRIVSIDGPVDALPEWSLAGAPVARISGEAPPYLGSVGEVAILSTGAVLVEDNQTTELHLFDSEGSHVRLVGGRGDGPGEFRDIGALTPVRGDTVWAYDSRHRRFSALQADGTLVRELTLRQQLAGPLTFILRAWPLAEGQFVVQSRSMVDARPGDPSKVQQDVHVLTVNASGDAVGTSVRLPGRVSMLTRFGIVSGFFTTEPMVAAWDHTVVWTSGLEYELVLATASLMPTRIIRWAGWAEPVTDSLVAATRDTFEQSLAEMRGSRPERADAIVEAIFAPEVVGARLPALRSVLLDDYGRIWISRFDVMDGPWHEVSSWHVLNLDGTPLARVTLPPDSRLGSVRGSRAALVVRDSLDVEHVLIYELPPDGEAR